MGRCFIIQPFDGDVFDRRCEDIIKPAIEDANLTPYRIDEDHSVSVPIDAIHQEIEEASACVADITTNNPNVWYELGYALALGKPTVLIKSENRQDYPFDIQHRKVIQYKEGSTSYLTDLQAKITQTLKSFEKVNTPSSRSDLFGPVSRSANESGKLGLRECEIEILKIVNSRSLGSNTQKVRVSVIAKEANKLNYNDIEIKLSLRRLNNIGFIVYKDIYSDFGGEPEQALMLTEQAYEWMQRNRDKLLTDSTLTENSVSDQETFDPDDELPF